MKQTPNVRPRACARTEEWSDLQPGRPHDVSGLSSAVTSGHPSETPSSFIPRTRSSRVPNVASTSGERAIVRRHGPLRRAALRNVDLRPSVENEREKKPVKIVEREQFTPARSSCAPPVTARRSAGCTWGRTFSTTPSHGPKSAERPGQVYQKRLSRATPLRKRARARQVIASSLASRNSGSKTTGKRAFLAARTRAVNGGLVERELGSTSSI